MSDDEPRNGDSPRAPCAQEGGQSPSAQGAIEQAHEGVLIVVETEGAGRAALLVEQREGNRQATSRSANSG